MFSLVFSCKQVRNFSNYFFPGNHCFEKGFWGIKKPHSDENAVCTYLLKKINRTRYRLLKGFLQSFLQGDLRYDVFQACGRAHHP